MAPPSARDHAEAAVAHRQAEAAATNKAAAHRLAGRYEVQYPLHFAARGGDWRRIDALLGDPVKRAVYAPHLEMKDPDGLTPLPIATEHGHLKVCMHIKYAVCMCQYTCTL